MQLSSVTVNAPRPDDLAHFYAGITGGQVTYSDGTFATMKCPGGRIDFQFVADYVPPRWPEPSTVALLHLDFLVEDLAGEARRIEAAGARRAEFQPNSDHCLVFLDPVGHPFCLTTLDEMN